MSNTPPTPILPASPARRQSRPPTVIRAASALVLLACAAALVMLPPGFSPAAAQSSRQEAPTPTAGWTLPPTWTYTPTRAPTDTPRPIPTRLPTATPTLTPSATPSPLPPPSAARLSGMQLIWQEYNGCAVAALTMMLLYHDWHGSRDGVMRGIKPVAGDPSVRSIEMVAYVESQGLRALARTGGTLDILRRLVAAGYPVLAENAYVTGKEGWMGHNRVVMGYDDNAAMLYTFDSVLGAGPDRAGRAISYLDFDALWQPFNRAYLVVYPPEAEPTIQAILGAQWNATENARWTLNQAQAEIQRDPTNAFALFNLGSSLLALGNANDAIIAFERALELGLPWRYLWYRQEPFEAYLQAGREREVIALGERVLNTTRGVEEIYYFIGQAHAALGEMEEARSYYQQALDRNPHFVEAEAALSRLSSAAG